MSLDRITVQRPSSKRRCPWRMWLSLGEHSPGVRGVGSSNLPVLTNSARQ